MPVAQVEEAAAVTPRASSRFRPRIFGASIAVLLALTAFLFIGPIGLGNGPLSVPSMSARIGLSTAQPSAYVATLVNTGGSTAVIDSVSVTAATGYAPAQVLGVRVASHSSFGCVYTLMSNVAGCARPPFPAAAGFAVAPHANTVPGDRGGAALVIEMAPPPAASCTALSAIVLRYHVGIRHYTATVPQGFVWACGPHAQQPRS